VFTRRSLIGILAGTLVLVAAVAVVHLAMPPRQTSDVAEPPVDATPEQVVTAYVDALNAHDCDTAANVMTPAARSDATRWCHDLGSLADVSVQSHFMERPQWSGQPRSAQVADVPVSFTLRWRPFHDDGSMDQGATTWSYLLVRRSAHAPWRIFDQGNG
jgi:hypothetical protein